VQMQTLTHQVDTVAIDQQQSCLFHCAQCKLETFDVLWRQVSPILVCSMCLQTTSFCKWFGSACLNIFSSRHTVCGGIVCTKGNLCVTILCFWSCEALSMLFKRRVQQSLSEEIMFLQTAIQCQHSRQPVCACDLVNYISCSCGLAFAC